MDDYYGIVANSIETDRVFRKGARVWICGGTGGEGWYRFEWTGQSRGGRVIVKWAPTMRFGNFRAAWIPEHLRDRLIGREIYFAGTRAKMEESARALNAWVERLRAEHPLRRTA